MKGRKRALSLLSALVIGITTVAAPAASYITGQAKITYEKNKMYDATETYLKVQPETYSYNGYKVAPFVHSDNYLSTNGLGEGMAMSTMGPVKKGEKLVIEFQTPIDSKKYETITLHMKQVPGNRYEAYNVNDDILSTVRKTISFGSYDVEKISFDASNFADSKGMVKAIMLKNVKAETEGQFFVDGFSLSDAPYKLGKTYDANEDYLKRQSATTYEGLKVVPFGEMSTFWSADAKVEGESGSALIASKPEGVAVVKGEVLVVEFVHEINAKAFPYVNLNLTTSTGGGATLDFYNVNEIKNGKLGKKQASGLAGFWGFATVSLPTASFADSNGNVQAIAMKLTSSEAATFSVGSFRLTGKKQSNSNSGTTPGNDTSKDSKNQYDGNEKNIVVQTADTYKGIKILPLAGCGSELAGWGIGEGKAVYTNENVKKGDVLAIQFVKPIDSKQVDLLTLSLKQIPGYSYSLYKGTDIKMQKAIKTLSFGSYDIEMTALRTKLFAEADGKVRTLLLKCESAGDPGQFFLDGYSLSKDTYEKGVLYDADEDHVKLQGGGTYGNLSIAPFNERTDFWEKEAKVDTDKGYAVLAHRTDSTSPKKGDLMVLEFVTDIDTAKFEVLNLTMTTSSQQGAIFEVFNVYTAKDGKNIQSTQRISADFWSFKTNNISLNALADENGYVGAIGLRLVSDTAETFSIGAYSLGSLSDLVEKGKPQILDNKISVFETEDAYEFVIEFNSTGNQTSKDNEETLAEVVSFNGYTLKEINKDKKNITLSVDLMGRYCMTLRVNKDYKGVGAVKNVKRHFVGNNVQIQKGYKLPNGEALRETYGLHVYLTDSITDTVSEDTFQSIGVNQVISGIDANGNLTINVYFTNQITGNPIYFLCNPDSFNKKNVASLNAETILYDATVAEAFIYGGYKSSLMDNIIINGNTVAEWMAVDELKGSAGYNTAVMVHYGQASDKAASIIFSGNTEVGKSINEAYESGTLDLRLGEGLKFSTGRELKKTVAYRCEKGIWTQVAVDDFAVYYDGQKVVDGQTIQVANEPSLYNVTVTGEGNYQVEEKKDGTTATYTVTEDGEKCLTFTVEGTKVTMPAVEETSNLPYVIGGIAGILLLAGIVLAIILLTKRRKQHA